MPRYSDLDVWKVSLLLIAETYRVTATLPIDERFGLTAQMRRASDSVACNMAEGYGRATRGEYLNQLSVARGSLTELEALGAVCLTLAFIQPAALREFDGYLTRVRQMLGKLRLRLSKRTR
jgi:four helix bundle protein